MFKEGLYKQFLNYYHFTSTTRGAYILSLLIKSKFYLSIIKKIIFFYGKNLDNKN